MRRSVSCVGLAGRAVLCLAIVLLGPPALATADEPEDEARPSLHMDFDASAGLSNTRFVSAADVSVAFCKGDEACDPPNLSVAVLRASLAVGWEAYSVEATLELPLEGESTLGTVASFGARVDTAPESWLSLQFRLAYVRRMGAFDGQGARFGVGVVLRPLDFAAFYGEGSGDVTTVPAAMNDAGTLFSYAYYVGGGIRLYVGML